VGRVSLHATDVRSNYDVEAVALETSMPHVALAHLPVDVTTPIRTNCAVPADLELRASFLLLHVDGQSSIRELAALTTLPVADVLALVLNLVARGLVTLGGTSSVQAVPASGDRPKTG